LGKGCVKEGALVKEKGGYFGFKEEVEFSE
jgi:hypothetical protein